MVSQGFSLGYGFVKFESDVCAQRAVAALNGNTIASIPPLIH
jgi:RNA recognition motif-containing protein